MSDLTAGDLRAATQLALSLLRDGCSLTEDRALMQYGAFLRDDWHVLHCDEYVFDRHAGIVTLKSPRSGMSNLLISWVIP